MNALSFSLLHVEDNEGDAIILEDLLEDARGFRFNITLATSLAAAMQILDADTFDIIILDLGLPDSMELQALEIILNKTDHAPIMVVTGMDDEQLGQKAIKMGAQAYIPKNEMNSRSLIQSVFYSMERHKHLKRIRNAEAELKENYKLLEEANKSKDKLLSIIAHDLKGPMSSVSGLLTMLTKDYDDFTEKQRKDYLRICQENTSTTYQLIETILAWAQSQNNHKNISPELLNAKELIQGSIASLQPVAAVKNIKLSNIVKESQLLYADPDMITTIVRNIVSNAIKFTYPNGKVEIGSLQEPGNGMISLYVKDNGVGISRDDKKKILDISEGYTTPGTENEKGTGFGLILCKEFIEKNKGNLWIESEKEKGTTVTFSVPTSPIQPENQS